MLKRLMMIGLLGISVVAMLGTATNVVAGLNTISCKTCKATGGSCSTFCAGALICDTIATGVHPSDIVECTAVGDFIDLDVSNPDVQLLGVLACGNKGSKQHVAAGVNPNAVSSVEGATTILAGDIDKSGKAHVVDLALPDLTVLTEICREDKPASTDIALDFTPCGSFDTITNTSDTSFETEVKIRATDGSFRATQYTCSLPITIPTCEALANALNANQVVQYTCTNSGSFKGQE
jgi:hypothetical protein